MTIQSMFKVCFIQFIHSKYITGINFDVNCKRNSFGSIENEHKKEFLIVWKNNELSFCLTFNQRQHLLSVSAFFKTTFQAHSAQNTCLLFNI